MTIGSTSIAPQFGDTFIVRSTNEDVVPQIKELVFEKIGCGKKTGKDVDTFIAFTNKGVIIQRPKYLGQGNINLAKTLLEDVVMPLSKDDNSIQFSWQADRTENSDRVAINDFYKAFSFPRHMVGYKPHWYNYSDGVDLFPSPIIEPQNVLLSWEKKE